LIYYFDEIFWIWNYEIDLKYKINFWKILKLRTKIKPKWLVNSSSKINEINSLKDLFKTMEIKSFWEFFWNKKLEKIENENIKELEKFIENVFKEELKNGNSFLKQINNVNKIFNHVKQELEKKYELKKHNNKFLNYFNEISYYEDLEREIINRFWEFHLKNCYIEYYDWDKKESSLWLILVSAKFEIFDKIDEIYIYSIKLDSSYRIQEVELEKKIKLENVEKIWIL